MRSLCRETGAFSGTYRRTTSPNGSDCQSVRHGLMACPYSKFSAFCNFFREKLADMGKSSYLYNVKTTAEALKSMNCNYRTDFFRIFATEKERSWI